MRGVQRYNLGDAPRRIFSFDQNVYDRSVRARRAPSKAMPLGVGGPFGSTAHVPNVSGFNGNFASLFTNVINSIQTDLGLTYGTTLLNVSGTGPAITFSGSITGPKVPIWVKATSVGALGAWTYAVYYDGVGTTPAMTGTSSGTVALTGAGSGLTLNISAGTTTLNQLWKATASAWSDQSVSAAHYSQATTTKQPVVTIGVNGYVGVAFDGVDDTLDAPTFFAASGGGNFHWMIWRQLAWSANGVYCGCLTAGFLAIATLTSSPTIQMYNGGTSQTNSNMTIGSWFRTEAAFTNTTSNTLKVGSVSTTGTNCGGSGATGFQLGNFATSAGRYGSLELLAMVICSAQPTDTSAADAAATAKYGGTIGV